MKRVTLFSLRMLVLLVFSSSSFATTLLDEDFVIDDGGFVSASDVDTQPWVYNAGPGNWSVNGNESNSNDFHVSSTLTSPTVLVDGPVVVNFEHLYSFERYAAGGLGDLCWDAGRVYVSINGGAFTRVALSDFLNNGYTGVTYHWGGLDDFDGGEAFCGNSSDGVPPFADYTNEDGPIPSNEPVNLVVGNFELDLNAGDSLAVQFFGHWDPTVKADDPNWLINYVSIESEPIEVAIDIKFCSDPNAFNCRKKGVLPVTIFGWEIESVNYIDPTSLQLCRADDLDDCTGAPRDWSFADRGDPNSDLGAAMCYMFDLGEGVFEEQDYLYPDGLLDLDVAFEAGDVQALLGDFCNGEKNGVSVPLVLKGSMLEGTTIFSVPIFNLGIDQLLKVNK